MKYLFFILVFIFILPTSAQTILSKSISSYEDESMAKAVFNEVNAHRTSIGQAPFIWSDKWYASSSNWNSELSKRSIYAHSGDTKVTLELIVGVTLVDGTIDYSMIADSCVKQWIHSPFHKGGLESPIYTDKRKTSQVPFGDLMLEAKLVRYGAISATVHDKGTYKIVVCVLQLGEEATPKEQFGK
jgi:hypothetical protein